MTTDNEVVAGSDVRPVETSAEEESAALTCPYCGDFCFSFYPAVKPEDLIGRIISRCDACMRFGNDALAAEASGCECHKDRHYGDYILDAIPADSPVAMQNCAIIEGKVPEWAGWAEGKRAEGAV